MDKTIQLIGYASDIAGSRIGSAQGPCVIKQSRYLSVLKDQGIDFIWQPMIQTTPDPKSSKLAIVARQCRSLAAITASLVQKKQFFLVLGGDHTSAIGTWSGVAQELNSLVGLIWIDAHMDSHTPETSLSGNLHGMPLACLLGYGARELTGIANQSAKLDPQRVCLIGVRSFEEGEARLLKRLNVRVFFMDEVKKRGLHAVFTEAIAIATKGASAFGVSIDIDSIDPKEAPGTGVREKNGLKAADLQSVLPMLANQPKFIGAEIVEFDPGRDKDQLTEQVIVRLISAMLSA